MPTIKLTSWNVEWMDKLWDDPSSDQDRDRKALRRATLAREILEMDPDILCLLEGPRTEARIDEFCAQDLQGGWQAIHAPDSEYGIRGRQFIWFLVRTPLVPHASLLPIEIWKAFTSATWKVHYWGDFEERSHRHYRHPQTLIMEIADHRFEFIGLHLKSKFVRGGQSAWNAGGNRKDEFIQAAIKARIKLTTEVANVRAYIDRKFEQVENPAIFVMGDLNDGPGKEYFERRYIFFDLLSNLQGDVFFARRFLNHALFDLADHLRWSVDFDDFVDPERDPHILLDHILFTQGLTDESLPWHVPSNGGFVEHEVHELVNADVPQYAESSDHRPVSLLIETDTVPG